LSTVEDVTYELALTAEEARQGTTKLLLRNNKRLQVNIPAGVVTGRLVKLNNALQVTDGKSGDILIRINVKAEEFTRPAPAPAAVVEIRDSTFEDEVLRSSLPVVVDFWAPWCGPCRMMGPIMDKAAEEYQGKFKFCKINVDENPSSASQYQAMSIPLLIFFKNGQPVDKSLGAIPESQLRSKLDSLL
jgi:thioredoxin 1